MGSRERRTRERADTRQRILDAARELFVRKGYEATTMRAIADRVEYTPTAIYHHFQNKEALLAEICAQDFRTLAASFRQIGRIDDPLRRLEQIGLAYVNFGLEYPMHYQLLFMTPHPLVMQEGESDAPGMAAYGYLRDTCAAAIASGQLRPEFQDPEELAQIAWASLHGVLALYMVKHSHDKVDWRDPRATATRLCAAVVRGLRRDS